MMPHIPHLDLRLPQFTKTNPHIRSDRMGYIQMPNGEWHYYNSAYQYSNEHGVYYNNQREETELVNSIVD